LDSNGSATAIGPGINKSTAACFNGAAPDNLTAEGRQGHVPAYAFGGDMHKKTLTVAAAAACSLAAILGQQTHADAAVTAHSAASVSAKPAAGPAPSVDTTLTFTVSTGGLDMTAPDSMDLGTGAPGTTIGPTAIGDVEVIDGRAALGATWTASVSSSDFTTGTATPAETIPVAAGTYDSGAATTTGTLTLSGPLPAFPLAGGAQTVFTATAINGDNTATWDPSLSVAVPAGAVGGAYTGTLTHSVA
jgi:hypothetical protein